MNRRDFFKTAILIPGITSLLPTLAKETAPTSTETTCGFPQLDGYVTIVGWQWNYFDGSENGWNVDTVITYRGTYKRIRELHSLLEKQTDLIRLSYGGPSVDELTNESGDVVGYVAHDSSELIATLHGRWHVEVGAVHANQTGVRAA